MSTESAYFFRRQHLMIHVLCS